MEEADRIAGAAAEVEQSRAEMRDAVADVAGDYVLALEQALGAERRWAQDVDRDDLADEARQARRDLDAARRAFDRKVKAEKGNHTRRIKQLL